MFVLAQTLRLSQLLSVVAEIVAVELIVLGHVVVLLLVHQGLVVGVGFWQGLVKNLVLRVREI